MNRGMCDGRHFTDYRSPVQVNQDAEKMSTEQYRQYLTNRAAELMKMQNIITYQKNGCQDCAYQPSDIKHKFHLMNRRSL